MSRSQLVADLPKGVMRLRWNPEVGWEGWCPRCPVGDGWWPLGVPGESFAAERLTMCIACRKEEDRYRAARSREGRRAIALAKSREYARKNADVLRIKRQERWKAIKADPERLAAHRAYNRVTSAAYRERHRAA